MSPLWPHVMSTGPSEPSWETGVTSPSPAARAQPEDRVMFGFHSLCSPIRGQVLWVGLLVFPLGKRPHTGEVVCSPPLEQASRLPGASCPQPYPWGQLCGMRLRQIEVTSCQMAALAEPSDTGQGPVAACSLTGIHSQSQEQGCPCMGLCRPVTAGP